MINYLLKYIVSFSYIELALVFHVRFNTKIMYYPRVMFLKKFFFSLN